MKPYEERKARERIEAGTGSDGSGGRGNSKTLAPIGAGVSDVGRVTEKLAEKAGVGRRTVERAIKVREYGIPELLLLAAHALQRRRQLPNPSLGAGAMLNGQR